MGLLSKGGLQTFKCEEYGLLTNDISHLRYHNCKETGMNFTFTTREEYRAYREDWKARYAAQIVQIRAARDVFKQANRDLAVATEGRKIWECTYSSINSLYEDLEKKRAAFSRAKAEAGKLLVERFEPMTD